MSDDKGIRVTCTDLATGESESQEIWNDYLIITAGNRYVSGVQWYPGKGTAVVTIKTEHGDG